MTIYVKKTTIWSAIKAAKRLHLGDIVKSLKSIYRHSDGDLIQCQKAEILSLVDKMDRTLSESFGHNFSQKWLLYRSLRRMSFGVAV